MSKRRNLSPKRRPFISRTLSCSVVIVFILGFGLGIGISGQVVSPLLETIIRKSGIEISPFMMASLTGAFDGIFGAMIGIASSTFWVLGKRFNARRAEEIIDKDSRLPILFLRSFQDDATQNVYEQRLTVILKQVGPVVALGKPYERLPPLGAARMYFNYDEWRDPVVKLMKQSSFVIIQAAQTPSLLWEISQARKYVRPERLLFSFVSNERYEEFRRQVNQLFPYPLPEPVERVMFLYFESDWSPVLLYAQQKRWYNWWESNWSKPGIKGAIKPFFSKFGIPLKVTDIYLQRVGYIGCILPFLFLGALLVVTELMILIIRAL